MNSRVNERFNNRQAVIPLLVVLCLAEIAPGVSVVLKSRSDTTTDVDARSAVNSDD